MVGRAGMAGATSRLERALVDAGHPLHRHLQPGLSAAEVDAFMRPTGLTLPTEAAAWWQWHDGTDAWSADHPPGAHELPGYCTPVSLEHAVERFLHTRDTFPWGDLRGVIEPTWFPLVVTSGGTVWVDCSGPPDRPAPVHHQYSWPDYSDHGTAERTLSVTLLVHTWAQMLEVGHWRLWHPGDLFDPRDGTAPYPLNIPRPQWGAPVIPAEERDPDLDLEWLLGVPP